VTCGNAGHRFLVSEVPTENPPFWVRRPLLPTGTSGSGGRL
jgi:hypothetical protein